jgi:hypothetical protein
MRSKINELGEVKRRSMMNWVRMISSWLFPYAKCKDIFPFSFFALTYVPLLKKEKKTNIFAKQEENSNNF